MDATEVTIALGTTVVFGVSALWLGRQTGIPSIVLLLLAGIVAGPFAGLVDNLAEPANWSPTDKYTDGCPVSR